VNKQRTVILHYHLFKNAGTSVDAILKSNFGDKWVTSEFSAIGGSNTALVEEWIRETPEAIAYSSHTMMGPIPEVEGVRVVSLMLLRDPIERIKSAYRFERSQKADTWGAQLAKEHDFEGYVRMRLGRTGDRQCRNFQTYRLASLAPGEESEIERARRALARLTVVGRVEGFDAAMCALANSIRDLTQTFTIQETRENTSSARDLIGMHDELTRELREANKEDIEVVSNIALTAQADQGSNER
jgi:hypothetical protein